MSKWCNGQLPGVVVGRYILLVTVRINYLPGIALLVKQAYANNGTPRSLAVFR